MYRKSRKLLMKGIEVLAHREHEQEGYFVVYLINIQIGDIYFGRKTSNYHFPYFKQNQTCLSQFLNVIRWIIWTIMIILNFADPVFYLFFL